MAFQPEVNQELVIDGVTYRIAEHPVAPGMPYGQEGRAGIVYQLVAQGGGKRALKVFKPRYRLPSLVGLSDKLAAFAGLPGLSVCRRTVLSARRHGTLLRQYPDLTYAVLMPWIEGPTWFDVMGGKKALSPAESLSLARSLAEILTGMEEHNLAHCDISGPNVLLPALAQPGTLDPQSAVALVDVEQLYGPGLTRPELLPSGSSGYAHKTAREGLWAANADRFPGAVLLAEMLGWCDERVREVAWGEHYFEPQEMQRDGDRYRLLVGVLRECWDGGVAGLFERAWQSETLADCATLGEWLVALPETVPERKGEKTPSPHFDESQTADAVRALMAAAQRLQEQENITGALEVYRQAQALTSAGSDLAGELALIVQALEKQHRARVQLPVPEEIPEQQVEDVELAQLFDEGLVAYSRKEWARAIELLEEVVRRQQRYERNGQKAAALLARAKRASLSGQRRPAWVWVLGSVILIGMLAAGALMLAAAKLRQASEIVPTAFASILTAVSTPSPTATPTPTAPPTSTPRPSSTPTRTPTPVPTATPVPASAILYTEDFEDGVADGWTTYVGTWSVDVEEGNHFWVGTGPNDYPQAWWGDESTNWTDYAFESRVRFIKGAVLICLRADSGLAFYNAYISSGDDWVSFAEYVDGNYTTFGDTGHQIRTRVWYTIRFEVRRNRLSLYINDELVTTAVRTSRERGGVGYYMGGGDEIHFDDIRVWELSP